MQTIGERLEEARKKKGVSIREAAEATKIRGDYLQKFESNQFDIGLTEIYTRGFLRTYANFLKVPADRIMSDYAALGRGEVRPRQPSREVYGRMDISVASAGDATDRSAPPPPEAAPAPEPAAGGRQQQPHYPRGTGSSLPTGPDPAVVFKWVKIGGGIIVALLVVLLIRSIFSGNRAAPAPAAQPAAASNVPPPAPTLPPTPRYTFTLVAVNPVHVRVNRKNPDESTGAVLFEGTLNRGDAQIVEWPGPVYIAATACENLQLEIRGRRIGMGLRGNTVGQLPAPTGTP
ncbi:helix-turn-helix domain-containing protein [Opitutus sp. ER46]|uniref:helix-turn-helix domain-containing protein n=1 Tax=Opitutus sp. ER46 TaxID=2161864 RepID=UPI000D318103|nr:helix-turn-helix domain-containing protein [Opitutus sp. ER46]PTX97933.1 XRE family transcriptional regulator [Opitutus sp. ER46]